MILLLITYLCKRFNVLPELKKLGSILQRPHLTMVLQPVENKQHPLAGVLRKR
jgi:hypothetical protein